MRAADTALNRVWRNTDDGRAVLLRISPAGLAALGIEADTAPDDGPAPAVGSDPADNSGQADPAPEAAQRPARAGRGKGLSRGSWLRCCGRSRAPRVDEIVVATGWQPHTVRGAFAGALKKRLGLNVVSENVEGRGRFYKIAD